MIAFVALVVILIVVQILRRSWGSSLDRVPSPLSDSSRLPSVRYNSVGDIPEQDLADVRALLAGNNKIGAIKRVRELTGLGLKEAKDAVEAMAAGQPLVGPPIGRAAAATGEWQDVLALIERGDKIGAIKRVRELTGLGLKEAKDYVDSIPAYGGLPPLLAAAAAPPAPAPSLEQVHALAQQGQKIQAIKLYRELTGVGLKEAKDYVDGL
jgi:ribosomal protein L7/L12